MNGGPAPRGSDGQRGRRPLPTAADASGRTFGSEELDALARVLRSGRLNSVGGDEVAGLERDMAELHGIAHAVACSSGTAALHLAMAAIDPEPGDEVITTPISDFGSVIPILAQNAVPVFADVDPVTGNIDPEQVERCISPRSRAILAVHLFGAPAPIGELERIAREHDLMLIEDCAQAYLAMPRGEQRYVGTFGHIGCFSLQQAKHITCGDGGLVLTDDPLLARRMRLFSDKGWPRDEPGRSYQLLGRNYRMTELQAAVARVQLGRLPDVVAARRLTAEALCDRLSGLSWLQLPEAAGHAFWMFPLVLDRGAPRGNHRFEDELHARDVPAVAGYLPEPLYANTVLSERRTYGTSRYPLTAPPARRDWTYPAGLCPNAERLIGQTLVALPWNERYSRDDVDHIAGAIEQAGRALADGRPAP